MRLPTLVLLFASARVITACDYDTTETYPATTVSGTLDRAVNPTHDLTNATLSYEQGRVVVYDGATWIEFFHDVTGSYSLAERDARICHAIDEGETYCAPASGRLDIHTDDDAFNGTVTLDPGQALTGAVSFSYKMVTEDVSSGGCMSGSDVGSL